jgi:glycosyltransferase involved in cell wall biosynthesis
MARYGGLGTQEAVVRIALVTGIFPPDIGGPASHAADVAEALRARDHDVVVVTLGDVARPQRAGGLVRFPRRWPWPLRLLATAGEVARVRPDVVYAAGMHEAATVGARLAGRPLVVRVPGDHAWERASRLGLTALSFDEFQRARGGPWRVRAMRALRSWAVRQAATVVVPSRYLEAAVRGWAPGVPVEVVPIGVDAPGPLEPSGPDEGRLRAVWVGRLVGHKRLEVLLEALARVEGVELTVVGDGPERARLEAHAHALGLGGRVRFVGALAREGVWRALGDADALLLASAYEGLPHVAIEALAVGTPVVAPDTAWAREVVDDGETGVLVAEAAPAAFAEVLSRLRDDPAWRRMLAKHAAAAAERWSLSAAADRIEAILQRAAGRPRAVFVGKGGLEPPESLPAKFAIFARELKATVVSVRPRGELPPLPVRVIAFPRSPKVAASAVFYLGAPALAVALAARRRGVVVAQSPYEAAGVHLWRTLLPGRRRPRLVCEVHGDWRAASRLYGSPARRLLAPVADRVAVWGLRHAERVRAVSAEMGRLVRDAGYTGDVDRFVTYSDFELFLGPEPAPPPSEPVVLFVGALEHDKGVDMLLDAFASVRSRVRGARLWVVGEGPRREELVAQARRLGLDHEVWFRGTFPRLELRQLYDSCRLLVLPSRSEGLPRVIVEAMARARPVVATRVGGIPELVEHGVTGLLVPPEDPGALADALLRLLADRDLAARMGAEARRRALARDPAREFAEGIARVAAWAQAEGR